MDYEEFIRNLGSQVKKLREQKGLTQENMEEGVLGVPYRTVQDIESGRSNASVRSLYRIARRLNVKVKDFFEFENTN